MRHREDSRRECVLRAQAAAEMADNCAEPSQRASFIAEAEEWLHRAEEIDEVPALGARLH